jgi:hypothetical protein
MTNKTLTDIQRLLFDNAREIEEKSHRLNIKYNNVEETKNKTASGYANFIKDIAQCLNGKKNEEAVAMLRERSVDYAERILREGLTLKEATDGFTYLEQAIWQKVEEAGLLKELTLEEYHRLNLKIGTFVDTVDSQVSLSYQEHYRKAEEEQLKLAAIYQGRR